MYNEESLAIKVKKYLGENARKRLIDNDNLRKDLKIFSDEYFIYLPIINSSTIHSSYDIVKKKFYKFKSVITSYKQIIDIPDSLKQYLPTSYDVIGNIILIKIPSVLSDYEKDIGKALIDLNNNIETVCAIDSISGELRIRRTRIIAGLKNTITIHKEFGLNFYVDVNKTYFSPRLANERFRISNMVKNQEIILDMFTGVAPFSIMIAKYANPKIIYAIDKNKEAIKLALRNLIKNKVLNKIEIINEDAKNSYKIINKLNVKVDRVIMNLPFKTYDFFPIVLNIIKENAFIHYYEIINELEIENRIKDLKNISKNHNFNIINLKVHKIKSYAPHEFYISIDITAKKILPT
jgi:tRNA (guanine37-N1)-methyltransferase